MTLSCSSFATLYCPLAASPHGIFLQQLRHVTLVLSQTPSSGFNLQQCIIHSDERKIWPRFPSLFHFHFGKLFCQRDGEDFIKNSFFRALFSPLDPDPTIFLKILRNSEKVQYFITLADILPI
jgi:hypothetical protein